jgi:flagellar biosynthesis/type III secretory pathway chaperone
MTKEKEKRGIEDRSVQLSEEELQERVAILKKLRETLLQQRDKFKQYLHVLDEEKKDIENEDVQTLQQHIEIEKSIVSEIFTFQKVIQPLEHMYRSAYPYKEQSIHSLQDSLQTLKTEVLERNEQNQILLQEKMGHVHNRILSVRKPNKTRSLYGSSAPPSLVDITT